MKASIPISVLMPAYNSEKYIGQSIESVLGQTFGDFELIIVDDGSLDGTWGSIRYYADRDKRIRAYRNESNLGIAQTRNKLIDLAQGKYIAWQDSDDISEKDRLASQYEYMESRPEVGICGGFLEFFDDSGTLYVQKYKEGDAELRKKIFRYSPVSQGCAMVREEALEKAGKFDPQFNQAEDLDMSFRIGQYYQFANLQKILVRYRKHDRSISSHKVAESIRDTARVRRLAKERYGYRPSVLDSLLIRLTLLFAHIPFSSYLVNPLFKIYRKIT